MPDFTSYDVEYTNVKPYKGFALGSGKMRVSIVAGTKNVKGKLKKVVEQKINSLGVRIDNFVEVKEGDSNEAQA